MRPVIASIVITLGLGCGHASAPPPADLGALTAEDQVDQADRNHDGVVDASEQAAADQAQATDLVTRLDRDGDHRLSAAEAKAATGNDAVLLGDFASHDPDGDGFLTVDDVRALVASHVAVSPEEPSSAPPRHAGRRPGRGHQRGGGAPEGAGGDAAGGGSLGDPDSPM